MAIEQLLDEFNDDQMLFRLEAGAYEEECLATMANRAPTTDAPLTHDRWDPPLQPHNRREAAATNLTFRLARTTTRPRGYPRHTRRRLNEPLALLVLSAFL